MRPILITGAAGTLGGAFVRICARRGLACVATTRGALDLADPAAVGGALDRHRPWLVVNAAGYVRVDDAETEPHRCHRDNTVAAGVLARACARRGVHLVTFSSDLVFDGAKGEPYHEHDRPAPLGVYGRTKAAAESEVLDAHPAALVVRTSAFFGPWDPHNFVSVALGELSAGRPVRATTATVSPTYVPDLVDACLDLAIDGACGLWHLASRGAVRWVDLARTAAALAGAGGEVVEAPGHAIGWRARRPEFSALTSSRGALLPTLDDALGRYLAEIRCQRARS
jgi:dTDP-4-dehydrorhamnose reductase